MNCWIHYNKFLRWQTDRHSLQCHKHVVHH